MEPDGMEYVATTKARRRMATRTATTTTPSNSTIHRFDRSDSATWPSASSAEAGALAGRSSAYIAREVLPRCHHPAVRPRLSPLQGRMGTMASAVIFDFYGTLARWADDHGHNYERV